MISTPIEVTLTAEELDVARYLAELRLTEQSRHHSQHRPTSRNLTAQLRGAVGELACRKWLISERFEVDAGFVEDLASESDLSISGRRVEVMTAQIRHREVTGFCVPPNKLSAARTRGAWGYIFVGTGSESTPTTVYIQAAVRLDAVDLDPPRETAVSSTSLAVLNHVVRSTSLLDPLDFLAAMRRAGSE
jgi:hypothetical protein